MDINIQVNIPAMELLANSVNRLADALTNGASDHLAGEMAAAIEKSMPEPRTAPAPAAPVAPAPVAPVNPTPAPAATQTAPVSTMTAPVTPAAPVQAIPICPLTSGDRCVCNSQSRGFSCQRQRCGSRTPCTGWHHGLRTGGGGDLLPD